MRWLGSDLGLAAAAITIGNFLCFDRLYFSIQRCAKTPKTLIG
jgi:hypothetical protein